MVAFTPKLLETLSHSAGEAVQTVTKVSKAKMPVTMTEVVLKPDTVEIGKTAKEGRSALEAAINVYNERKFTTADKFGSTKRILNNWKDIYGIEGQNGGYKYAIEHLDKSKAIDKFITERFPEITSEEDLSAIKSVLTKYLEKNLDIYSYKRIDSILRSFNKDILPKLEDGAVLYVPDEGKSYNIITEMYKRINPDAKVVTGWNKLIDFQSKAKDLNVIVLDDCLVSGESAIKTFESIKKSGKLPNVKDVDMYFLTAYEEGLKSLPKDMNVHYAGEPRQYLRNSNYFRNEVDNKYKGILMKLLGTGNPKYSAYSSIMFPYMSPNNNSLFGAQMIKQLFSGPECAIKGFSTPVLAEPKVSENIAMMLEKARAK